MLWHLRPTTLQSTSTWTMPNHALIAQKRGKHNRLGFAVQLGTVRYLGTFLTDPLDVPKPVLLIMAKQLSIELSDDITIAYNSDVQRRRHATEIRSYYGYVDITERQVGFRLTRWLYALCWTGTDRPSVLFERATTIWLMTHKILLPGCSTLERYVARLRSRVEERFWRSLGRGVSDAQQKRLESLLTVSDGSRTSLLDQLRTGPVLVSSVSLIQALRRLHSVRELGIKLPAVASIPAKRIAALARFAGTAKVSAILRLPNPRRLATLVAFVHCLEATAQDDALEVLEALLRELFGDAIKADKKARQRTIKDLDRAAITLAKACRMVLDNNLPDSELRVRLFEKIPRETLAQALDGIKTLTRPADNVYFKELDAKYRTVRRFLPALTEHIRFNSNTAGKPLVASLDWLQANISLKKPDQVPPNEIIGKSWQGHVIREGGTIDFHAYTFCVLEELKNALKLRDVFVAPSWRYADPHAGLLNGAEWETTRPIICRTLGLSTAPEPTLKAMAAELDLTYRAVAARLPDNPAVRFDMIQGKQELVVSPLDKVDDRIGGQRFWRIDQQADYGMLNAISAHRLSLKKIAPYWDDMLRLSGSLLLGRVPAIDIMRTLQVGNRPTRLAQAIAEFGLISKTQHTLTNIDDEAMRRNTLIQLNRVEGRHSVARVVFHGKRGELRQHYREGQEDQLGALGLVLNMMGRYSFSVPEIVANGELRPLRDPADEE